MPRQYRLLAGRNADHHTAMAGHRLSECRRQPSSTGPADSSSDSPNTGLITVIDRAAPMFCQQALRQGSTVGHVRGRAASRYCRGVATVTSVLRSPASCSNQPTEPRSNNAVLCARIHLFDSLCVRATAGTSCRFRLRQQHGHRVVLAAGQGPLLVAPMAIHFQISPPPDRSMSAWRFCIKSSGGRVTASTMGLALRPLTLVSDVLTRRRNSRQRLREVLSDEYRHGAPTSA